MHPKYFSFFVCFTKTGFKEIFHPYDNSLNADVRMGEDLQFTKQSWSFIEGWNIALKPVFAKQTNKNKNTWDASEMNGQ